jgi:hypothetical protein
MAERGGRVARCGARLHRPTGQWFSVDGGGGGAVEVRGLSFLGRGVAAVTTRSFGDSSNYRSFRGEAMGWR